jgi:CheY-like chemotaxis protein/anti-sigma regulatory factor (Ser/Thr protein kinase)
MASGIAHDINNALSPAALYVESLRAHEPGVSERGRHQLEVVGRAIDDVSATVARMREFYRERGEQVVLAPVDLNLVVQQVADLTRARWSDMQQERGAAIDLRLELADGLPRVSGADHELREALTNLVFNAVDAMPQGGRLVMRTRLQPGGVAVEVQDSGIGMDEETRRRCLEPFFTTKGERGTGLGLAMVYGVAQRHEAHIEIDTAPGAGTCIRMVLPPAAGTGEPGERAVPPPRPARLLVVDDDPLLRESLADTLGDDGHTVVIAPGGAAGVDAFCAALGSDAPFDAVFTDLGMPGMDGREVARRLKAAAPGTPVILLTGWGPTAGEASPGIAEVDRVMSKPPRRHDLRAALGELLGGRAHA